MQPVRIAVFGAILAAALLRPVFPQSIQSPGRRDVDNGTRTLKGVVQFPNGKPADNAVVLLKDTKTLQVRSFVTKEDGAYHFYGLSTNDEYEVRAQRNNISSNSKILSSFDERKEAKINLKLKQQ